MAPRETENNAYTKFGVTNKEHYGTLWYFLEWSIIDFSSYLQSHQVYFCCYDHLSYTPSVILGSVSQ